METKLPAAITTIDEAKAFLTDLYNNEESYHPEDDANDLNGDPFTKAEGDQLNKLMGDIYNLPGNNTASDMVFDPCAFLLWQDKDYLAIVREDDPELYLEFEKSVNA